MIVQRYSRQRAAIASALLQTKAHPTAEMLYDTLRREHPNISLGTVYRNLALLEEQGMVRRITISGQPDRFDGDVSEHHHLICNQCGAVVDLPCEPVVDLARAAEMATRSGIEISDYRVLFIGACQRCVGKRQ